ncbi:MAG: transcriptional regulator NrdR [Synechococcales cyanobacterium K44_A2020_017]|uniref:transcriptional regulator NrdR n=1 Tax=Leptolyngbya sp. CCY15150 TaxID=2767772 RepID=UPI0019514DBD|nr:transcriptional regulator NrdR [Leptolyngbya sp. CCY15150]MBF2090513.1 transcriptional regulator NrdR [Synechococcales cyanobacterium K32_A2020_035]MBF2094841.1 transcriptional regulator NrdR [Synechococcales cyanobacterium K44_A2020_017]
MRCPFCQFTNNRVLESRAAESGQSVRRRRECLRCGRRFTTYERIEFVPITVVKRDGDRESFDRSKVLRGIVHACEKTGVSAEQIENFVDELESELQLQAAREVLSTEIGDLVLQRLQRFNEVAYIRFASVYRQFQGIQDFIDTLNHLQQHQGDDGARPSPFAHRETLDHDAPFDEALDDMAPSLKLLS